MINIHLANDILSPGGLHELGDIYPWNPGRPVITLPADNSESFTYDPNANLLTISGKGV